MEYLFRGDFPPNILVVGIGVREKGFLNFPRKPKAGLSFTHVRHDQSSAWKSFGQILALPVFLYATKRISMGGVKT